ncbi:MAG: hypothetical protein D3924_14465, partial [Candidatus Electrothrix sp. AR4]|nr:hypothetical protein [Candidatus Electrothrix sp. AR4]
MNSAVKIFFVFFFASLTLNASWCVHTAAALTNGEPVAVSISTGTEQLYSIQIPSNAAELEVTLSGMTGDLDLYTKFNASPSTTSYDCRPFAGSGSNETCTHTAPEQGTWYIMVRGFSEGNATLTATYATGSASVTELANDTSLPLSLSSGTENLYSIQIPADATELEVTLSGMTGDLDLYSKFNASPSTASYDCRPYAGNGSNETCTHSDPSPGTWYILVRGYSAGNATLTVRYTTDSGSGSVTELANDASLAVSLSAGSEKLYSIQIPADATELEVTLSDMTGDLDLYTKFNASPNTTS